MTSDSIWDKDLRISENSPVKLGKETYLITNVREMKDIEREDKDLIRKSRFAHLKYY